jgi:peptide/nickel transport system permease protein
VFLFIVRRFLVTLPLLVLASVVTFLLVANLGVPQQLENVIAKPTSSPAAIQSIRNQFELDTPLVPRYTHWVGHFVRGDFGQDGQRRNVRTEIWRAIQVTLRLLVFSLIVSVVLSIIVGLVSAVRQYSAFDYGMTGMAFFFFSIPTAVLAAFLKVYGIVEFNKWARHPTMSMAIMILLLAVGVACGVSLMRNRHRNDERKPINKLIIGACAGAGIALAAIVVFKIGWDGNVYRKRNAKPLIATIGQSGDHPPAEWWPRMQDYFWHMLGPSLTLILVGFAGDSRYMRASMLDTLNSDYVRTARAKGVSEFRVIMRHAFRNALIPLTTSVALEVGGLLSGAIITETVFGWKGMGSFFSKSLQLREPKPLLAFVMITAVFVVLFNLVADILYARLDPRIRLD